MLINSVCVCFLLKIMTGCDPVLVLKFIKINLGLCCVVICFSIQNSNTFGKPKLNFQQDEL